MQPGVRAVLSQIVDYAGLFPPARLPLAEALANYLNYRASPDAWMLARMVFPASQLGELPRFAERVTGAPLDISCVFRPADSLSGFASRFAEDLAALSAALSAHAWLSCGAIELRVPAGVTAGDVASARESMSGTLAHAPIFFEPAESSRDEIDRLVSAVSQGNEQSGSPALCGVKLRCGGPQAQDVPDAGLVAHCLGACRDAQAPLKFTAGLHHPLRRRDPELRTFTHGFLNVFVAGILAHAVHLSHHDLLAILDEQDPRSFSLGEPFIGWSEAEATLDEVRFYRRSRLISFGSCSLDEPTTDLRALGLI